MIDSNDIIEKLEKRLRTFGQEPKMQNVGKIEKITDEVVIASGLSLVKMGEIVLFKNGAEGVILNLAEDNVSIIVLSPTEDLREGDTVKSSGRMLGINASKELLGRVVDPRGNPLDGKSKIKQGTLMPLEHIAPGVVEREPVNTPLKTGIKAIDGMVPVGRGQRELIIGDRGLGKSAIAIDTIINQRQAGKNQKEVICIYVSIGQKQSRTAQVISKFKEEGAMDYTIVVAADSSDPASLQYLAPFAGSAIAEYFMNQGLDVLIAYDDLTKHAWAYRELSLILRRPAGREAYPGDIFYLHSRLLERAVKLNKKNGGGSITALPIIETQADDISAYIPTNVISITDGQIYLKAELFNLGMRPAIDVGNSVSRVGGAAQTGAMKSVASQLRLELAQYRELAVFAQFGSELDPTTAASLERGRRTTEILKQPQYQPLEEPLEVLSLFAVENGFLDDLPIESIAQFEKEYHDYVKIHYKKIIDKLKTGEKINEETSKQIKSATAEFKKIFTSGKK